MNEKFYFLFEMKIVLLHTNIDIKIFKQEQDISIYLLSLHVILKKVLIEIIKDFSSYKDNFSQ